MRRTRRRLGAAIVGITITGLIASSATANPVSPSHSPHVPLSQPVPLQLESSPQLAGGSVIAPLTLITGDQVKVGLSASGELVATEITQAPRPDHGTVVFHTLTRHGQSYVVPDDTLPLLHEGVLDWELFNLAKLAAHVMEGTINEVPVIISHAERELGPATVDGATVTGQLTSINASSMTIDGDGQWWQRARAAEATTAAVATLRSGPLVGVEKVWLNELARLHLEDSVPQVNAPVAWDAGYDGTGVTVAVLDTGIDENHPDVAGKIVDAVNFTTSPAGWRDVHGHGTHVAATALGTGAASDGLRTGVAPGADLLVGKVCLESGGCPTDAIIAGMEWAAQSGAQVVNMSLGAGATDGTDPMSQAVNQLSQQYGTLFVTSAGNSGPGASTVGTPSVADAALSVAAIDKSDQMANFSSRGPRVGDGAMKPEIAAPGVSIIAARAAGSSMGSPVGNYHTSVSGTSMAAPHVAGAAAVVAQANPDLSGEEIKGLLMSTATDLGHDVHAQGAGRLEVGNAADPSIFLSGSLAFGRYAYPHSPVTRTITYANVTDQDITLSLEPVLAHVGGTPAPAGLLTVSPDQVTVPAGGSVEVQVTLDGGVLGEDGRFGGYRGQVRATDGEGQLRSTAGVSAVLESPSHEVTIEMIAPDGAQDVRFQQLVISPMGTDRVLYHEWITLEADELVQTELFEGVYTVVGVVRWRDADGEEHIAVPKELELVVSGPESVTLDLREAKPARADIGEQADLYYGEVHLARFGVDRVWGIEVTLATHNDLGRTTLPDYWWVLPTDPVTTGTFTYRANFILMPSVVELRATGGGSPIDLQAQYSTLDSAAPGVDYMFPETGPRMDTYDHPVPRLASRTLLPVVDGGAGTEADLAGVDVEGALVLIQPTDVCSAAECDFEPLHERVSIAGDAGAAAVAVADEIGRVTLPNPPSRRHGEQWNCDLDPQFCPEVVTYADVPVVSVAAGPAAELRERLQSKRVQVRVDGSGQMSTGYALGFVTDDQVPGDLPHQVDAGDLHSVEHRFHSDQPGEVAEFNFARVRPGIDHAVGWRSLPRVSSQQSVELLIGPKQDGIVEVFQVRVAEWVAPLRLEPQLPGSLPPAEEQALEPTGGDVLIWNPGVSVPAAPQNPVRVADGSMVTNTPCAGCREGDRFWPNMYVASSGGTIHQVVGTVNDTGISAFLMGFASCQLPECTISLTDSAGTDLEQTLLRIELVIGEHSTDTPAGEHPLLLPAVNSPFGAINVELEGKEGHR